jgi:hypothetical protein
MNQPNYSVERVLVTPAIADRMLQKHMNNRNIVPMHVTRLASAMTAGEFRDGEPIKFDKNENLIDGQHRLKAIIKSGCSIHLLVLKGYEPDSATVLDLGKNRTAAHIAKIQGDGHIVDKTIGIMRLIIVVSSFSRGGSGQSHIVNSFTKHQIIELAKEYYDPIVFASREKGATSNCIRSNAISAVIARAYIAGQNVDRLNEFIDVVHTGMPKGKEDTAAQKLREMFLKKDFGLQGQTLQSAQLQYTQSALSHFLKRESRTQKLVPCLKNLFPIPDLDCLIAKK